MLNPNPSSPWRPRSLNPRLALASKSCRELLLRSVLCQFPLALVAAMACVGRAMSRSFLSTARSSMRASKTSGSEAVGRSSMKGGNPCAPSPAAPSASSFSQTRRPASYIFRLPGEVACVQSLLPLHSVTASSRLVAQLSTTAGALFQGGVWLIDDN